MSEEALGYLFEGGMGSRLETVLQESRGESPAEPAISCEPRPGRILSWGTEIRNGLSLM